MIKRDFFLHLIAGFLIPFQLIAAETHWKAGAAVLSITPKQPVPMAGYAARTTPFERVEHDIHAKALALEDADGHRAVLVTTDLVGIPGPIAQSICERIQKQSGLPRNRILLSSSHTHSAPLLTEDERTRYNNIDPNDGRNLFRYTRTLQDQIVKVALEALGRMEPARLSWGSGLAHFAMNRRQFVPGGVTIGVNPRGLVDRSVPVMRIENAAGTVIAALFSYACHNTTLTGTNHSLCGDYAGFAQLHVEAHYPKAAALFMMGCGGDANPHPRGTMTNARDHGAVLGAEVCRVLESSLTPLSGPLTCAFGHAELPLEQYSRTELERMAEQGPSWRSGNARQLLARLDASQSLPKTYPSPVSVWQFGQGLTLVGMSGEVVVDYVPLLEQAIGPLNVWITAYCNDVFGYVPSRKTLREGGYECRGLYIAPGFFAPDTQDALLSTITELARQARAGREK